MPGEPRPWGRERERAARAVLRERLDWLGRALALTDSAAITSLVEQARTDGLDHLLLLGMGGSVLAPVAIRDLLAAPEHAATMTALDTTDPAAIRRVDAALDPARTLIAVATKSGTTIETLSLLAHWWERIPDGRHFVAITDAGSPLDRLARERNFRAVLPHTADPIGRFGAFTPVGVLPAAWLDVDIARFHSLGRKVADRCEDYDAPHNPARLLAERLATAISKGIETLAFVTEGKGTSFVQWASEPLSEAMAGAEHVLFPLTVAPESVQGIPSGSMACIWDLALPDSDETVRALRARGVPVLDFMQSSDFNHTALWSIGWFELALPVAAALIGPRTGGAVTVDESKSRITALLERVEAGKGLELQPLLAEGGVSVLADGPMAAVLSGAQNVGMAVLSALRRAQDGETVTLCPFFSPSRGEERALTDVAAAIAAMLAGRPAQEEKRDMATARWDGPALLHGTGQLLQVHDTGVTLVLTREPEQDLPIPGQTFTFGTLIQAQALGYLQSLWARNRWAAGIHLQAGPDGLERFAGTLLKEAGHEHATNEDTA